MNAYRKPLVVGIGAAGLLLLAVGWLLFTGDNGSGIGRAAEGLTVAEVYRDAERYLRESGAVHKVTIEIEVEYLGRSTGVVQRWIDPERNVAREEQDSGATVWLLTSDAVYRRSSDQNFKLDMVDGLWICHGAGDSASMLLGCPRVPQESRTHIEDGDFSGKSALVLMTEGKREGNDQTHTFTERLYLDPKTLLPFAKESDGEVDHGETTPLRERWLYTYETLSANQVPEDFFSPW